MVLHLNIYITSLVYCKCFTTHATFTHPHTHIHTLNIRSQGSTDLLDNGRPTLPPEPQPTILLSAYFFGSKKDDIKDMN